MQSFGGIWAFLGDLGDFGGVWGVLKKVKTSPPFLTPDLNLRWSRPKLETSWSGVSPYGKLHLKQKGGVPFGDFTFRQKSGVPFGTSHLAVKNPPLKEASLTKWYLPEMGAPLGIKMSPHYGAPFLRSSALSKKSV